MPRFKDSETLRKRITKAREDIGLNQAELAEKAGVTPAAISQIEKGARVPSIPVLQSIANVLKVSLDYLIGKTDSSELQDLMQRSDFIAFYRAFESLEKDDKQVIEKHIQFLKSQHEGQKNSDTSD